MGHGTYLSFGLSFVNFILITYNFLFNRIPYLDNMVFFAVLMLIIYTPLAIAIGHYHNTKQMFTDNELSSKVNPYTLDIIERLKRIEEQQVKVLNT